MLQNGESPALSGDRALEMLSFGGEEHNENIQTQGVEQAARAYEVASRFHHAAGRLQGGAIGRTEIALAEFYGRAARQMMGAR